MKLVLLFEQIVLLSVCSVLLAQLLNGLCLALQSGVELLDQVVLVLLLKVCLALVCEQCIDLLVFDAHLVVEITDLSFLQGQLLRMGVDLTLQVLFVLYQQLFVTMELLHELAPFSELLFVVAREDADLLVLVGLHGLDCSLVLVFHRFVPLVQSLHLALE